VIYAEDIAVGRRYEFGSHTLSREEILGFAREWDPLYLHADEAAAEAGPFGGLIASGIHTLAVYMRLAAPAIWQHTAMVAGRALREIQFPRPVRPGTTVTGHLEWREVRPRPSGDAIVTAYAELHEAPAGPQVFSILVEVVMAGRGQPGTPR
jgi:acyl dehydratase